MYVEDLESSTANAQHSSRLHAVDNPQKKGDLYDSDDDDNAERAVDWFCGSTTAHGIPHAFEKGSHPVRRTLWVSAFLLALSLFAMVVGDKLSTFLRFEKSTSVTVTFVPEIEFPRVTLCNVNIFQCNKFPSGRWGNECDNSTRSPDDLIKRYPHLANVTFKEAIDRYGETRETFLPYCEFKGEVCSTENLIETYDQDYGRCYTFVPPANASIYRPGEKEKFFLMINVETENYMAFQPSYGAKLVIHDKSIPPIPNTGLALKPGHMTQVSVIRREIVSLNNGDCYFDVFQSLSDSCLDIPRSQVYSVSQCYRDCEGELIETMCHCTPRGFVTTPKPDLRECRFSDLPCIGLANAIYEDNNTVVEECKCTERCDVVDYSGIPASFGFPAPRYKEQLLAASFPGAESYDFDDNIILLEIFFRDLNLEKVTESWAYPPTSLLSDLGGNMGLFVGFSLLTMMEVIEFCIRCCCVARYGKHGKKTASMKIKSTKVAPD